MKNFGLVVLIACLATLTCVTFTKDQDHKFKDAAYTAAAPITQAADVKKLDSTLCGAGNTYGVGGTNYWAICLVNPYDYAISSKLDHVELVSVILYRTEEDAKRNEEQIGKMEMYYDSSGKMKNIILERYAVFF